MSMLLRGTVALYTSTLKKESKGKSGSNGWSHMISDMCPCVGVCMWVCVCVGECGGVWVWVCGCMGVWVCGCVFGPCICVYWPTSGITFRGRRELISHFSKDSASEWLRKLSQIRVARALFRYPVWLLFGSNEQTQRSDKSLLIIYPLV